MQRAVVISNDEPISDYGARRLAAAFGGRFEVEIVSSLDGFARPEWWPADRGADVLVLSGSERSVNDDLPWMLEEQEMLRAAVAHGVPLLAVCFGHQLLARALGVDVVRREKRVGLFRVRPVRDDPLFDGLSLGAVVPEQHSEHVSRVPDGFELVATSDYCTIQAMRHREAPIYGVQFHPCYGEDVFDVEEEWEATGLRGRFEHDGVRILANAVRLFEEHCR